MLITKASGEKVQFSLIKYQAGLKRVGLSVAEAKTIAAEINQDLYPEITSEQIYQRTRQVLKKHNRLYAAKYSLKRAIMELGPTGFYFERYLAAILSYYGYKTKYNQFLFGRCVQHEVDVVAERDGRKYMIECKYHNQLGQRSDVKVALYVYARFLDLKDKHRFDEAVLATNTRFTTEAVRYAECMGVKIIGWHHPVKQESLEYFIESKKLYPVTVLTAMTGQLKKEFRDNNLILIQDLLSFSPESLAKKFRLKPVLAARLIVEAKLLAE